MMYFNNRKEATLQAQSFQTQGHGTETTTLGLSQIRTTRFTETVKGFSKTYDGMAFSYSLIPYLKRGSGYFRVSFQNFYHIFV